jgi:methionyl-tRNA formyltransferase
MNFVIAFSKPFYKGLTKNLEQQDRKIFVIEDKNKLSLDFLDAVKPRYIFFPHWSYIIPKEIYEKYECVIFHMTDLPFGRGGSPLQNLIVRGIKTTKMSALRCSETLDSGPIYFKRDLALDGSASEIFARAAAVIESMIEEILERQPIPVEQIGEASVFQRRTTSQSDLASVNNLETAYDYIRMLDAADYPAAFIESDYLRFEFSNAEWDGIELKARVKIGTKRQKNEK